MHGNSHKPTVEEFITLYHTHEPLIKKISSFFCAGNDYSYRAMVCDLTTHLWLVMQSHPPGPEVLDLESWVYSVLYHAAINLTRQDRQFQTHHALLPDLPDLPDIPEPEPDPLVAELYRLISQLTPDEQVLITEYLDRKTYAQMAASRHLSTRQIGRRLKKIQKKLIKLNAKTSQP